MCAHYTGGKLITKPPQKPSNSNAEQIECCLWLSFCPRTGHVLKYSHEGGNRLVTQTHTRLLESLQLMNHMLISVQLCRAVSIHADIKYFPLTSNIEHRTALELHLLVFPSKQNNYSLNQTEKSTVV